MKAFLYWLASLTWGGIMTWIGIVIAIILSPIWIIKKRKPQIFGHNIYFEIGKGWGGVNFGAICFVSVGSSNRTKCHEHGHGLQNICWGVLFPFVIALPSAYRYWMRDFKNKDLFAFLVWGAVILTNIAICVVVGVTGWKWLLYICLGLAIYVTALTVWAFLVEIPRYSKNNVPYDSIWFEGQATKWGTEYIDRNGR